MITHHDITRLLPNRWLGGRGWLGGQCWFLSKYRLLSKHRLLGKHRLVCGRGGLGCHGWLVGGLNEAEHVMKWLRMRRAGVGLVGDTGLASSGHGYK